METISHLVVEQNNIIFLTSIWSSAKHHCNPAEKVNHFGIFLTVKRDNSCVPIKGLDPQREPTPEGGSFRRPEGQTETVSPSSMKESSLTETNCAFIVLLISMKNELLNLMHLLILTF